MRAILDRDHWQTATPGVTTKPLIGSPNGFESERSRRELEGPGTGPAPPVERAPSVERPTGSGHLPDPGPLRVLNGAVYFNGDCEACRPYCAAVCCKGYSFVSLTEAEARSGLYVYKEESRECDCSICQRMRELDTKYALMKRQDGSCVYLDGTNRCSIYDHRPQTCRQYTCAKTAFRISP